MASLRQMREEETKTDVTLKLADGSTLPCHKLVLMAACPYFKKMFSSNMKENIQNEVILASCHAETVKLLIEYFYSGEITITMKNVQNLIMECDYFCLDKLKPEIEKQLTSLIDSSNCLDIFELGKKYELQEVSLRAHKEILDHFKDVVMTDGFLTLTEEDLIQLLKDDELNAEDEDAVFMSVVRWVKADLEERKEAFIRIAHLIRFPFCTHGTITNILPFEPLMSNPECLKFIQEAQHLNQNTQHHIHSQRTIPRRSFNGKKQRLVRFIKKEDAIEFQSTDCIDDSPVQWRLIYKWEAFVDHFPIVAAPKGFYWLQDENWFFLETASRTLTEMPWKACPGTSYTESTTFLFFNGKIWALGGRDKIEYVSSAVHSLDVSEQDPDWKAEEPMLHALRKPLAINFANKLYVFGGIHYGDYSHVSMVYDPLLKTWKQLSDRPGVVVDEHAVALNEKIYVFDESEEICSSYSPSTDEWTVPSQRKNEWGFYYAVAWKGKILVINECAEEYDPERNEWSQKNSLDYESDNELWPRYFTTLF